MKPEAVARAEREKELVDCLTWLQHRMDEYDDKEAYQDDYKMASIAWNFIRARTAENAELKEAQRWVPVSERTPIKDGDYLTVCYAADRKILALRWETETVRGKTVSRWKWYGRISHWEPTHWYESPPLPQPPEKGE